MKTHKSNLNAAIVVRALASGKVKVDEGTVALAENKNYKFATGERVYIISGYGGGQFGTLKEINESSGTATVDCGAAGQFAFIPIIFLQKSVNRRTQ